MRRGGGVQEKLDNKKKQAFISLYLFIYTWSSVVHMMEGWREEERVDVVVYVCACDKNKKYICCVATLQWENKTISCVVWYVCSFDRHFLLSSPLLFLSSWGEEVFSLVNLVVQNGHYGSHRISGPSLGRSSRECNNNNNIIIIIATIKGSAPVLNSLMEYLLIA